MAPTRYTDRTIPKISMRDFDARVDEVTRALVTAAEADGFFVLTDHGIPQARVDDMFVEAEAFFALPDEVKAAAPFSHKNAGWEKRGQVRPSTGQPDQKESYQIQFGAAMDGLWPPERLLPAFRPRSQAFMATVQALSERLMVCLARGLGFADGYFVAAHDAGHPNSQSVLRLLHYFALDPAVPAPEGYHRAGAHADWSFLTLLFQRRGQGGLEMCPGREAVTDYGLGDEWTRVEPVEGEIVCNIGDLLMSWSDDRFRSTFHRVKTPSDPAADFFGDRYSMAFFNQPHSDCNIQGPLKKYPMVTGKEFTAQAMKRNFAALEKTLADNADTAEAKPAMVTAAS